MAGIESVCVFCGASNTVSKTHLQTGEEFGKKLAENDIRLIYGGGDVGIMGAVANSVMRNGGRVTGVFPLNLRDIENEHQGLTEILIVGTMHERKQRMFELSQSVVVLPGGFGTLDEMFEIITWKQLMMHNKPIIIFNNEGYWDPLIALMHNVIDNGFARQETRYFFKVVDTVDGIIDELMKPVDPTPVRAPD